MSHSRRYLKTNALTDLPEPTEDEKIAQVLELRGSNLVEVECADGEKILCQIPTKFRKLVWIRRGNFIILRQPQTMEHVKVKGFVEHILFSPQVKHLIQQNLWPEKFMEDGKKLAFTKEKEKNRESKQEEDGEEEDQDSLFVNPNHQTVWDSEELGEDEEVEEEEET